jgi:hypothetical protein
VSNRFDFTRRIKAKGCWHRAIAIRTRADIGIDRVNAGCPDADTDLIRPRLWHREIHDLKDIWIPKL